jgi:GNAT superfamily N-acetyltransferase
MDPFYRAYEFIDDWLYLIHREGLKPALSVVSLELARLPYRHLRLLIFASSLSDRMPDLPSKIPLDIIPFEASHLEWVRAVQRPSEARLCQRRLARRQHGLVALFRGQMAGYAWGCFPVDWELERLRLQLEPGDILCTDAYTTPELRGKGVQTALTLARFRKFRDLGFRRAICYIDVNNQPSLAVWQKKFGAQTVGGIDFFRIGPWYKVHTTWSPARRSLNMGGMTSLSTPPSRAEPHQ